MSKSIMVVDDNKDVRHTLRAILKNMLKEHSIIEVDSGNACLDLLKKGTRPDLILLDIMMPGIDGWTVASRIKEDPKLKKIPVIFLSAKIKDPKDKRNKELSEDYIEKPFDIDDLSSSIKKALR